MGQPGKQARLYKEDTWTDGNDVPGVPSWTLIARAVDIDFAGSAGEADVSSRVSDWVLRENALKDAQLSTGLRKTKPTQVIYDTIRQAWLDDTKILIALADGDIATTPVDYWQMVILVQEFNESWPLTDGEITNVTMNPAAGLDASGNTIAPTLVKLTS